MKPGTAFAAACIGALAWACGSGAHGTSDTEDRDGGHDAAGGGELEAGTCSLGDTFCGGVCLPPSVNACGPTCAVCAQPATSHGQATCATVSCTFECAGGYSRCATESCCGDATTGNVTDMAVGGETTCAVTTTGAVWCWGDGSYGVLGGGETDGASTVPARVVGLPTAKSVVVGDHHACALLGNHSIACWGDDEQGQLGDGQGIPRGTPDSPQDLSEPIAAVTAGGLHTCALTMGGAVWCWGDNTAGQLGDPSVGSSSLVPIAVVDATSGIAAIAAGEAFTCALTTGGEVLCWGDGSNGQLGGPAQSGTPVHVALPSTVTAVATGEHHACAILQGGGVDCWGADDQNELGSAGPTTEATPRAVPSLAGVVSISAGGDETCAIDHSGAVTCWGSDPVGDVGMGPAGPAVVPSLTSGIATVAAVAGHACAVTTGGAPKCWGQNGAGQLGDGTMVTSWAPIDVTGI